MSDQERYRRLESLFHQLVDLPAHERAERMDALGQTEPALAADLARMLSATHVAGERVLDDLARHAKVLSLAPGIPETIGPFRVLRLLGEGGMGRVYEAEQSQPVQRRVAVKLTHAGLDNARVVARFHAERQALAVLDHPNIARIFEAGSHSDGRPWFAMELVDGIPITEWASRHDLGLRERLELLLPVCDAIGHAHRKGVIHRDLKPSNILVSDIDGKAMPKIIDFGIAKALHGEAADDATHAGELIGTPEYMSPEQASLGAIDIDTRSDVYALGLVLFELLVGQLPLTVANLRRFAFDEMCRRVREEEAPPPSTVLSANRPSVGSMSSAEWARRVQGDLDAVVLKALAKDREQRYDSVSGLADDLRRYLNDQPVHATPPSWRYRLGKFIKRHRAASMAAAVVALALMGTAVMALRSYIAVRDAMQVTTAAQQQAEASNRFLLGLFRAADPRAEPGRNPTARDLLSRGFEQLKADTRLAPEVRLRMLESLGEAAYGLGDYAQAEALFEEALALHGQTSAADAVRRAHVLDRLGVIARDRGDLPAAIARHREALAVHQRAGPAGGSETSRLHSNLAIALRRSGDLVGASAQYDAAIGALRGVDQPSQALASAWLNRAAVLHDQGQFAAAIAAQQDALAQFEQLLPPNHPNFAVIYNNMSMAQRNAGALHAALALIRKARANEDQNLPATHPDRADSLHNEAAVLIRLGQLDTAQALLTEALTLLAETLPADNPRTAVHRDSLAEIELLRGNYATAISSLSALIDALPDTPATLRQRLASLRKLALAQRGARQWDVATATAQRSIDLATSVDPAADRPADRALGWLLQALIALDRQLPAIAAERYAAALQAVPDCAQGPCALDQGSTHLLRAQYLARSASPEAAMTALEYAIADRRWSASILTHPDLTGLHSHPRWSALQAALDARLAIDHRSP
jgi:non-specific serine/threonine protein kinase/serine/threonine-protein kinase